MTLTQRLRRHGDYALLVALLALGMTVLGLDRYMGLGLDVHTIKPVAALTFLVALVFATTVLFDLVGGMYDPHANDGWRQPDQPEDMTGWEDAQ